MTEVHQQNGRFDFRAFMLKHQYEVMFVSVVAGFTVGIPLGQKTQFASNKSVAGNDLRILGFSAGSPLFSDLENA